MKVYVMLNVIRIILFTLLLGIVACDKAGTATHSITLESGTVVNVTLKQKIGLFSVKKWVTDSSENGRLFSKESSGGYKEWILQMGQNHYLLTNENFDTVAAFYYRDIGRSETRSKLPLLQKELEKVFGELRDSFDKSGSKYALVTIQTDAIFLGRKKQFTNVYKKTKGGDWVTILLMAKSTINFEDSNMTILVVEDPDYSIFKE